MRLQNEAILVVDDEKDILVIISKSLEYGGIRVHAFDNPISALEHVKAGCQDCWLMLSDVRMPQLPGFELVRKIKELRPGMIVLLMTAFEINKDEFDKVLPSTKVDGFIRKPASLPKLVETIKQYKSMRAKPIPND